MVESVTEPEPSVRHRIVAAARRLFADKGYAGTSLQAVADAVGIRKPSLLYHFRSKDILRRAVLDDVLAHWKSELPHLLARSRSGKDRFAGAVGALVGFFEDDPSRARIIVREMLDQPELVERLLSQLEDLEELREDLTEDEYNETKADTLAQLKEFQASLAKMASGSMTLQSNLEATRLAVQAAVSSAFQTPEVIRLFASKQPAAMRRRLAEMERDVKLGKLSADAFDGMKSEMLVAQQFTVLPVQR